MSNIDRISESSYSSEDEDGVLLTDQVEKKLLSTYVKLKNKDESMYNVNQPIFEDEDFQNANSIEQKKGQKKYTYEDLVKEGDKSQSKKVKKGENKEVDEIKNSLKSKLKSAQKIDDNLFTVKQKQKIEEVSQTQKMDKLTKGFDKKSATLLEDLWKNEGNLDQADLFLKKYILDKKWLSSNLKKENNKKQEMIDEEDEERSQQIDEYEAQYNFRYQEPGGTTINQFPREIPESVRQKSQTRKEKRKKQEQNKKKEEERMRQEAEQMKNKKKNQILDKLNKNIEEQFDNDWFFCDDCTKAFTEGEDHFVCEECEDYMLCEQCQQLIIHKHPMKRSVIPKGFGPPAEEVSQKMLAELKNCRNCRKKLPKYLKRYEYTDRSHFLNVLCQKCYDESNLETKKKFNLIDPDVKDLNFEELLEKNPQKIKQITTEKDIEEMIDDYLRYDFEDVIGGGMKTKFKYVTVKPESYGLSDEQILYGDDKQLNGYVSIKNLAPYSESDMKLRNSIYNKKVKSIDRSVKENRKLITKNGMMVRGLQKMKARAQILKKRRENKKNKLKIINISNPDQEKKYFIPNSRLASYGIATTKPQN